MAEARDSPWLRQLGLHWLSLADASYLKLSLIVLGDFRDCRGGGLV